MKNLILFVLTIALSACSTSSTQKGKYGEEKNAAKYTSTYDFVESPEKVLRSAKTVLENWTRESDPPTSRAIKEDDTSMETGWIYGQSKDKFVEYKHNNIPRRKTLAVRRKYKYTAVPSLSGSQISLSVEEELEQVDLKSGERTGWKSVDPDPKTYDRMLQKLRTQVRAD